MVTFTASFSDREVSRNSKASYTHAWLIEYDGGGIDTGFASSEAKARTAAINQYNWCHQNTKFPSRYPQSKALNAAIRKAHPYRRLEVVAL